MTQKAMAELFDVNSQAITKHIGNILEEGELEREATCSKMEQVQQEGNRKVRRNKDFYNKEYITKGFILNGDMLKMVSRLEKPIWKLFLIIN